MLSIQGLHKSFKGHMVLDNLSLKIGNGSINGIVGMNGAGKTTLLNIIWGKLAPTECTHLQWEGEPLKASSIAFLEAQLFFYARITGKEYLQLFQQFYPDFDFEKWNQLFQLPLKEMIENYSSGMKKKLAFMSILASDAPLIILDEPFNNLDLETNLHLKQILSEMKKQGKTMIVTSHILEVLTSFADSIHLLNRGKITQTFQKESFDAIENAIAAEHGTEAEALIKQLVQKVK